MCDREVGANLPVPGDCRIVDARGHYVLPGGVDPDTSLHVECPSGGLTVDDFYSGSRAALSGGTTTLISQVIDVGGRSLVDAFDRQRKAAEAHVCCDFALHVAVTSVAEARRVERELDILVRDRGVASVKLFMAFKGQVSGVPLASPSPADS